MSSQQSVAVESALASRSDLDEYGTGKRLLFALQLDYEIEDISTVAEDALVDGSDDKSCDLVYVDRDRGHVVIAQAYEGEPAGAGKWAPESKAASLHQAVSWILTAPNEQLPERLRDAANEVRDALRDERVTHFRIWFVHNRREGGNALAELDQTAASARSHLASHFPESAAEISVAATEIGPDTLAAWYAGAQTPILVQDPFVLDVSGGCLTATGDNWSAVCASVPATWLHEVYSTYGSEAFSANVRGYLGSVKAEKNINNGIKESAQGAPQKFWAYNNGITAVVNDWDDSEDGKLKLTGLAIVNGAQTTGAIGSVDKAALQDVQVMARFIKCGDLNTVREIIRFNNRQNPTQAADFRSNDRTQRRLREEFDDLGVVEYTGGRRGGASDVIKRPADNMIAAAVAAQALAAFHGRPSLAYHEKGKIWEDDATYGSLFADRTSARHILLTVAALKSIEREKSRLKALDESQLDSASSKRLEYLRRRGSQFLLLAGLGACAELFVGAPVPDRFALTFKSKLSVSDASDLWAPVLDAFMPLASNSLEPALQTERGLRSDDAVAGAVETFRALVESVSTALDTTLTAFRSHINVS